MAAPPLASGLLMLVALLGGGVAAPVRLPELRWRMPGVALPMRYERTEVIARIRALGALPLVPQDARECAEALLARAPASASADHARVAAALVLLGAGAADEAHNIVTPLSWHYGTTFGGPPVEDSPAVREATFAHALIHRLEANHPGEFGTGFHNSAFWFNYLNGHFGGHEIYPRVRDAALAAAAAPSAREHRLIQRWVLESCLADSAAGQPPDAAAAAADTGPRRDEAEDGRERNGDLDAAESAAEKKMTATAANGAVWSPTALNSLLAQATATPDDALRAFCERVAAAELELLLSFCLERCGLPAAAPGPESQPTPAGSAGAGATAGVEATVGGCGSGDATEGNGDGGDGRGPGGARGAARSSPRMAAPTVAAAPTAAAAVDRQRARRSALSAPSARPWLQQPWPRSQRRQRSATAALADGAMAAQRADGGAELIGLQAARRVSEAHAHSFSERGAVVVRRALAGLSRAEERRLAAAALIARLIDSSAVWCDDARADGDGAGRRGDGSRRDVAVTDQCGASGAQREIATVMLLAAHATAAVELLGERVPFAGGCELGPDDALVLLGRAEGSALRAQRGGSPTEARAGGGAEEARADGACGEVGLVCTHTFASAPPASAPHAVPAWRDPLHGKRGHTPTTVVEWSKGPPAAGEVQEPPQLQRKLLS